MIITAVIALASTIAWAVTARALFRHWVRNDTLGQPPLEHRWIAALAAVTAPFLPVLFPVLAFAAFVMHDPPLSPRDLERKTRALEAENDRLRRKHAGLSIHGDEPPQGPARYYDMNHD